RPAVALEQKNPVRTARSTVGTATEIYDYLRLLYAKIGHVYCPACGAPAVSHSPESIVDALLEAHPGARAMITFRLAVPAGLPPAELWANLTRRGFARVRVADDVLDLAGPPPADFGDRNAIAVILDRVVLEAAHRARIVESVESALREGGGRLAVEVIGADTREFGEDFRCSGCGAALERPQPLLFSFNHPLGACPECKGFGNVLKYDEALVVPDRARTLAEGAVEPWTHPSGKWYQKALLKAVRRHGLDPETLWAELGELALTAWEAVVAREILRQLNAKLTFLLRVGLGYLTLARQTRTLSGGEAQRINLANQLGSQLVGTLYVLDEPSIGLHPRDTMRLVELCRELARAGNTVVVVEHDRDRKSTRLNSSHVSISYAVFCLKKKKISCKIESFVYGVGDTIRFSFLFFC